MRILAAGSEVEPPRSRTACNSLPPGGAAAPAARQSRFRGPCLNNLPQLSLTASRSLRSEFLPLPLVAGWGEGFLRSAPARRLRFTGLHHAGFTLLELLVVIAIIAVATAGVSLSLRDSSQTALEREAQRLAVLFESARAQSRASGTADLASDG